MLQTLPMDSFDGTGKPYRDPSFRAVLMLGAAILLALAIAVIAASWALNHGVTLPGGDTTPTLQGARQSP